MITTAYLTAILMNVNGKHLQVTNSIMFVYTFTVYEYALTIEWKGTLFLFPIWKVITETVLKPRFRMFAYHIKTLYRDGPISHCRP